MARVQEVLDKYNYLPNPSAKGLSAKKPGTIALFTADVMDVHYSHAVFTVEQELRKKGYNCLLMNTGTDREQRSGCMERTMQNQVGKRISESSKCLWDSVRWKKGNGILRAIWEPGRMT